MTDHDPLCEEHLDGGGCHCVCDELARARADERERIAQAMPEAIADRVEWDDGTQYIAVDDAARIARNGGTDVRA